MKNMNITVKMLAACGFLASPWLGAEGIKQVQTASGGQSWATASIWSNSSGASTGNDYFTNGYVVRTPDSPAGSTVFPGNSLTIDGGDGGGSGALLLKSGSTTIGNLNLISGLIRNGNSGAGGNQPAILNVTNFTVGSSATAGSPAVIRGDFSGQDLTVNVSNLMGSGYLQFVNQRTYTLSVVNGRAFSGVIDLTQGGLILEGNIDLANAQFIINSGVNSVVIGSSVSVKSFTFGGVELGFGNHESADLNEFFGTSVFSGGGNITVVPEASTYTLLMSGVLLLLIFGKNRFSR